jgi:anti-sigma factor RsiW
VSRKPATCRGVVALLTEYMEGGLGRREVAALESHLAGCVACAAYLATLRTTRAAVRGLREEIIPHEVVTRLRAYLARKGVATRARI